MNNKKRTNTNVWWVLIVFVFMVGGAMARLIWRALEVQGRNEIWSKSDQTTEALYGLIVGGVCACVLWIAVWCLRWVVKNYAS